MANATEIAEDCPLQIVAGFEDAAAVIPNKGASAYVAPLYTVDAAAFVATTDQVTVAVTGVATGIVPVQIVPLVLVSVILG